MSIIKYSQKESSRSKGKSLMISSLVFVAVVTAFILCMVAFSNGYESRQKEILENALLKSLTECYVLEGEYPKDLDYLKENYSLKYDENVLYVDYRYYGSNIRPDTQIIELR